MYNVCVQATSCLCALRPVSQVVEACVLTLKADIDLTGRSITIFRNNDLSEPLNAVIIRAVILGAIKKQNGSVCKCLQMVANVPQVPPRSNRPETGAVERMCPCQSVTGPEPARLRHNRGGNITTGPEPGRLRT